MATDSIPQKQCSTCKRFHPATRKYFHSDKKQRDGLTPNCKECRGSRFLEPKEPTPNGYKKCPRCKRVLLATPDNFHKSAKLSYGLANRCKRCVSEVDTNPDYKDRRRNYHHKPGIKEARLARTKTPEFRAKRREYNQNPTVKERIRKEHADPHYRELERKRAKKQSSLDRARRTVSKRNTIKKGLPFTLTDEQWKRALDYFDHKCAVCRRSIDFWTYLAQDHWIPLSNPSPDNPGTVAINIVPLCHSRKDVPYGEPACNMSKKNHDAREWLIKRFGKRKANETLARINGYFEWVKLEDSSD